jgi:large subunit ribosomal protein L4
MYRGAMRCILSELVRQERLVVVEGFDLDQPKTKLMAAKLKELSAERALIVAAEVSENVYLASRNLPKVEVCDVQTVDPVSLIAHDKVIITVDALKKIEEQLA